MHDHTRTALRIMSENTAVPLESRLPRFFFSLSPEEISAVKADLSGLLLQDEMPKFDAFPGEPAWEHFLEGEDSIRRVEVPGGWLYCTRIVGQRAGQDAWSSWWSAPAFVAKPPARSQR